MGRQSGLENAEGRRGNATTLSALPQALLLLGGLLAAVSAFLVTVEAAPGGDGFEGGQKGAAQFDEIERTGVAVNNVSLFINHEGVGQGATPLGIDGFDHGIFIGVAEHDVAHGSVLAFEKFDDFGLHLGVFGGDGDEFKIAVTESHVEVDEIGKFGDAGAAPCGPKIDDANLAGVLVLAESAEGVGVNEFDAHRLLFEAFGPDLVVACGLFGPFHRATENAGRGDGGLSAGQQGVEGIASIMSLDVLGELGVVDTALETEFAIFVVDEDMRGGDRAEDAGNLLGGAIVEVGEVKALVLGADLHVGEGVTDVSPRHFVQTHGVGIIGVYGDDGDALGAVILGQLDEALFVALGGGAVIAGEDDAKKFGVLERLRSVGFAVGSG